MREVGIDRYMIGDELFPGRDVRAPEFQDSAEHPALIDALRHLSRAGLLDVRESGWGFYSPSRITKSCQGDYLSLWRAICQESLSESDERVLAAIRDLTEKPSDTCADIDAADSDALLNLVEGASESDLRYSVTELSDLGFVEYVGYQGGFNVAIAYRGLVYLNKQGETAEAEFIDKLVDEWETTSVEFKRDLNTNTMEEKVELVKDLLALANTQASGRRWLIIGFDARTHAWSSPPQSKLSQDHFEQLIAEYIEPNLTIRYDAVDYRGGAVGRLEVIRERHKLPYRFKRAIGQKRAAGDWFVRHGSQVELPTDKEASAIFEEGDRARAVDR